MKRKIPKSVVLYDTMYDDNTPKNQLFVIKYDTIPSTFNDGKTYYNKSVVDYFLSIGYKKLNRNHAIFSNYRLVNELLLVNDEKHLFLILKYDTKEKDILRIHVTYDLNNGEVEDQIDYKYISEKFKEEKKKSNISLMKKDMSGLDLEEFDINIPDVNLLLNYGKDFLKVSERIVTSLNIENGSGIVLLHGDPGTGKTTYLKHLTKAVKDKEVIFIPPSVAGSLSDPSIIPFLMEHTNSILIIEDAEKVIGSREINGSDTAVSNILNLTDGILGDCLGIQIIATFNMKKEKIDNALLRKGRLIAEHKFTSLSVDESNDLLKHIGKDIVTDKSLTLADIYYIDIEEHRDSKERNSIGF